MTHTLCWSPRWRSIYDDKLLIVTGGADEIFAIEDVEPDTAREVVGLSQAPAVEPDRLSPAAQLIVEQLVTAGIIEIHPSASDRTVTLEFVGEIDTVLERRLMRVLDERNIATTSSMPADFLILIRTNGRLRDLLDDGYRRLEAPHLLIDLAYHHTCSVGPLVFPGDTTCLGCLVGRLSTHWGDAVPPRRPRMVDQHDLVTGVAALEIERVLNGDHELINTTVSYDFGQRTIKEHRLFKLPWCPICGHKDAALNGGLICLPWTDDR